VPNTWWLVSESKSGRSRVEIAGKPANSGQRRAPILRVLHFTTSRRDRRRRCGPFHNAHEGGILTRDFLPPEFRDIAGIFLVGRHGAQPATGGGSGLVRRQVRRRQVAFLPPGLLWSRQWWRRCRQRRAAAPYGGDATVSGGIGCGGGRLDRQLARERAHTGDRCAANAASSSCRCCGTGERQKEATPSAPPPPRRSRRVTAAALPPPLPPPD